MRGSRQVGEEEFVDDAGTRDANRALLFARGMSCHDHAAQHPLGPYRHRRTVVEAPHERTFRSLLELIRGQVQTRLDKRMIEYRVLLASGHESEASEIGEHSPRAILSVEPEQGALLRKLERRQISTNGRESLAQFRAVESVASVSKTAEPVETVGLADNGASSHHLPPLAPFVARRTDVLQPAKGWRQVFGLRQSSLRGRPRASHQCQRPPTPFPLDPSTHPSASRWSRWGWSRVGG